MFDPRPRLKKSSRLSQSSIPPPIPERHRRLLQQHQHQRRTRREDGLRKQHDLKRQSKLRRFERYLQRRSHWLERRTEILPYFAAMLASGIIRCRPVKQWHREWIIRHPDPTIAAQELFRLAFHQHCESVDWPVVERS